MKLRCLTFGQVGDFSDISLLLATMRPRIVVGKSGGQPALHITAMVSFLASGEDHSWGECRVDAARNRTLWPPVRGISHPFIQLPGLASTRSPRLGFTRLSRQTQ